MQAKEQQQQQQQNGGGLGTRLNKFLLVFNFWREHSLIPRPSVQHTLACVCRTEHLGTRLMRTLKEAVRYMVSNTSMVQ